MYEMFATQHESAAKYEKFSLKSSSEDNMGPNFAIDVDGSIVKCIYEDGW